MYRQSLCTKEGTYVFSAFDNVSRITGMVDGGHAIFRVFLCFILHG